MSFSIVAAQFFAIMYLAIGRKLLFNPKSLKGIVDSLFKNSGATLMYGIFVLLIGFIVVTMHNMWVKDWRVLITIIGWGALIKGIFIIITPDAYYKMAKAKVSAESSKMYGIISIIIALILAYYGFAQYFG